MQTAVAMAATDSPLCSLHEWPTPLPAPFACPVGEPSRVGEARHEREAKQFGAAANGRRSHARAGRAVVVVAKLMLGLQMHSRRAPIYQDRPTMGEESAHIDRPASGLGKLGPLIRRRSDIV